MNVNDNKGLLIPYCKLTSGDTFRYHGDIYIKSEWYGDIGCASVRLTDGYTTEFNAEEVVSKVDCNCEVLWGNDNA